jgi:nucleoside 2-deoxyribosyltransferase
MEIINCQPMNILRKPLSPLRRGGAANRDASVRLKCRSLTGSRVYLAARFARREQLIGVARMLESSGVEVACRWLFAEGAALSAEELDSELRAGQMASMDFEDLRAADVCLAFTEQAREPQGRGGRHAEVGIALGLGHRVILVGPREHVFHCLPQVEHFASWEDAQTALRVNGQPPQEQLAAQLAPVVGA